MNIKLQSITLRNFKGIRDLTLTLNGADATISGENGAGKTTIVDAFLWLLFNKDSENRGQFEVKTLDERNRPIHNLEHEVEAVLKVDGKRYTLRKLYKETWTRKRGKSEQVFDGHTTDYWVNEEPYKAKEYADFVSGLIQEDTFRLITNPLHFSTKLKWEDRRKALLALCGEITPDAVIAAAGSECEGLAELLDGRTPESVRKIIMDKRKMANDELDKIPAQIEAVNRTLPDPSTDYAAAETELAKCKKEIAALDAQMNDESKALDAIREKGKELARLEVELSSLKTRLERESRAGYEDAKDKRERLEKQLTSLNISLETQGSSIRRLRSKKLDTEDELTKLRAEHEAEYKTAFTEPAADEMVCKACGQDLPAAKRTELIENARERFETTKAANLKSIETKGKRVREEFESAESELATAEQSYNDTQKEIEQLKLQISLHKADEDRLMPTDAPNFESNAEYAALQAQIAALRASLDTKGNDAADGIAKQREAVYARQEQLMKTLSERDASNQAQLVIIELTSKERQLSDQIAEFDGQLYMIEKYARTEAELLEGNINAKFKTVRFKLFEEQVNGGLRPTCEALIGGVPFSDANTAGQFNAGMEIIEALCEHYGVYAPVFVDRCESINSLTPITSQVIRMTVVSNGGLAVALETPGAVSVKAAKSDLCINIHTNKKQEVA